MASNHDEMFAGYRPAWNWLIVWLLCVASLPMASHAGRWRDLTGPGHGWSSAGCGPRPRPRKPVYSKATDCPSRVYASPFKGERKYMATVLGLADYATVYGPNSTRLPSFRRAWARA